ncbi:MAG: formylglycine-generating enzyme family protein [Gammaproteobacteria bacterium]
MFGIGALVGSLALGLAFALVLRDRAHDAELKLPEMVKIPDGAFQMGCGTSDTECAEDEKPARSVAVPAFRLAKYEVTVGQFRVFVEATGYRAVANCNWRAPGFVQDDAHPVVCVTWSDARAYASWLSEQTGDHYRLPSEAEWEYATRAGSQYAYSFGNNEAELCRYANVGNAPCNDGFQYTAPVGRFQSNEFGLHDVHGNVVEWTQDVYQPSYADAPSDGSAALSGGDFRVLRGGSWRNSAGRLRSAFRFGYSATGANDSTGFRLARDP